MSLNIRGLAAIIPTLDVKTARRSVVLGWPKVSFGFFCNILWKNLNELFGQPNTWLSYSKFSFSGKLLLTWIVSAPFNICQYQAVVFVIPFLNFFKHFKFLSLENSDTSSPWGVEGPVVFVSFLPWGLTSLYLWWSSVLCFGLILICGKSVSQNGGCFSPRRTGVVFAWNQRFK